MKKFFANRYFTSATWFFSLNQPIIGPLWWKKFWLVILSGAYLNLPWVKNRQKTDFSTFRNINSIFSKTVRDRKMSDPNFYSESNGESNGLVVNSRRGWIYPDRKAQSRNFWKKLGPQSTHNVKSPKWCIWPQFCLMMFKEDRIANPERPRNPNYLYWFGRYEFLKLTKKFKNCPKIIFLNYFF